VDEAKAAQAEAGKSTAVVPARTAVALRDTPANRQALTTRFGNEFSDGLTVTQFIGLCQIYRLNPFMGHITPFQGRPYIQREGWLHLVQREAPGQLKYLKSRPATPDEYGQFRVSEDDYFAVATVVRRWPNGSEVEFERRAIVAKAEATPSARELEGWKAPVRRKARHIVEDPWDMAEKRAQTRVLRMAFNDCLIKAGGELPTLEETTVDRETGEIIESSAVAVPEGPPPAPEVDWSRLWAIAHEFDLDRPAVHAFFKVPPNEGALKDYAEIRERWQEKTLAQVVQDMADELDFSLRGTAAEEAPAPLPEDEPPAAPGEAWDREQGGEERFA